MLRLDNVKKYYRLHRRLPFGHEYVKAVDGVSFDVSAGESFGIVGESGSGKSTLAKLIVMLEKPTDGIVYFENQNLAQLPRAAMRKLRRDIQIVFQDAYASLNPRLSMLDALTEPLYNFDLNKELNIKERLEETLTMAHLPQRILECYPSELSGGERQRACIARALISRPRLIIFDEATSGLDVTLQNQILRLLSGLRKELGLTYLFITHNLSILPVITDRVGVIYGGRLLEVIDSKGLNSAVHPYTKALLAAAPAKHPRDRRLGKSKTLPVG